MELNYSFTYKMMQLPCQAIYLNVFSSIVNQLIFIFNKMNKLFTFTISLILVYLPASNLISKSLSCDYILFEKPHKTNSKPNGLLYQEMDEIGRKKTKFLEYIGDLKHLDRSGWVMNKIDKPETVSGHMHRMSLIAMILDEDELKQTYGATFDLNKVIKMTLIHDMAECITGDYTPYDKIPKEKKQALEVEAIQYLTSYLPDKQANKLIELFDEYEERKSPESILTKEIDRFDLVLQAFQYEKQEYEKSGLVPDFEEFFDFAFVLSEIRDKQLKELVSSIMKQRSAFLKSVCGSKNDQDLIEN